MKKLLLLIVVILIVSCNYIDNKYVDSSNVDDINITKLIVYKNEDSIYFEDQDGNEIENTELLNLVKTASNDIGLSEDNPILIELDSNQLNNNVNSRNDCSLWGHDYRFVRAVFKGYHWLEIDGDLYQCLIYQYTYECSRCSLRKVFIAHSFSH